MKKPARSRRNSESPKRILIVDDHPMMRDGLGQLIAGEPDLEICAEAENAAEAMSRAVATKPDLALIDISLPGKGGLALIQELRAALPELLILVISMHDETVYAERVLRAGGRGYIMKLEGGQRIMEGIRQVLAGQVFLSPRMSGLILQNLAGAKNVMSQSLVHQLSNRELEVLRLIAKGSSTKEIAECLGVSPKTVEVHRLNIKRKLEVKTAAELIRFAVQWEEANPG